MKIQYIKAAFLGLVIGGALVSSCTKADRSDDFPAGDAPSVPGGYTKSSEVAPANLVGYWDFNGAVKDAVSGTTGTAVRMTYAPGLKGQAIKGLGTDSAYAISPTPAAIASMSKFTISIWINSAQNNGATGIFSIGDTQNFWANINIFMEGGSTASRIRLKNIYDKGGASVDNGIYELDPGFNKWVHYVSTYDGNGTFKEFVNGSPVASKSGTGFTGNYFTNVGPIIFGTLHFMTLPASSTTASTAQGWAGYIPGRIDEVRIFNKDLSAQEITALSILERQGR